MQIYMGVDPIVSSGYSKCLLLSEHDKFRGILDKSWKIHFMWLTTEKELCQSMISLVWWHNTELLSSYQGCCTAMLWFGDKTPILPQTLPKPESCYSVFLCDVNSPSGTSCTLLSQSQRPLSYPPQVQQCDLAILVQTCHFNKNNQLCIYIYNKLLSIYVSLCVSSPYQQQLDYFWSPVSLAIDKWGSVVL